MYYVYVLKSIKSKWLYVGYTYDLKRRLKEHEAGKSATTARVGPMELIYYESFRSSEDAKRREGQLKHHGASLGHLKKRIKGSIDSKDFD